ncbi:hypothetical protein QFC19_002556 [Naganishia cerealis]|uniref:Uncharacterized protein n=1 Tax=Naganishia cerealis TaxID=610337 RepID=A0ACC2WAJ6_9TREE|nr:hypothetical protein QFC19_002556 [Naganishia cerealis]
MLINPKIKQESLAWKTWTSGKLGTTGQDLAEDSHNDSRVIEDDNDTFEVIDLAPQSASATTILEQARSDAQASSSGLEFARKKTILCSKTLEDVLPAMPLFQADVFFEELVQQRLACGQTKSQDASRAEEDSWSIGDVLLYGEAVTNSDGKLGVRIKWPNDIYAEAEGIAGSTIGKGIKGRAKLGGILVNSSFVDGRWKVIVGCGINVLNELPTTSLSQLHRVKARRTNVDPDQVEGETEQVSMEKALAGILVSFEGFWNTFLEGMGFENLLDEYLGRWLHT